MMTAVATPVCHLPKDWTGETVTIEGHRMPVDSERKWAPPKDWRAKNLPEGGQLVERAVGDIFLQIRPSGRGDYPWEWGHLEDLWRFARSGWARSLDEAMAEALKWAETGDVD